MQEVADAVLAIVAAQGVTVHDANVLTDQDTDGYQPGDPGEPTIITVELPYGVIYMNLGDDYKRRLAGRTTQRSVFWQFTSVGGTPEQCRWVAKRQRRAQEGKRLTLPILDVDDEPTGETYKSGLITVGESQRMRRDDTTTDPNGNPVYLLVDTYSVKLSKRYPT